MAAQFVKIQIKLITGVGLAATKHSIMHAFEYAVTEYDYDDIATIRLNSPWWNTLHSPLHDLHGKPMAFFLRRNSSWTEYKFGDFA